jgi:hypothetical protein
LTIRKDNATKDESGWVQLKGLRMGHAGEYNPQLEIQNDIRTRNCSGFPLLLGPRIGMVGTVDSGIENSS